MGQVYLAHDTRHDRRVAIKVLDAEYAGFVGPKRFVREIQMLAQLAHPNIIPLYDSGEIGGLLFYVMPYVEGESLRHRLEKEPMIPVAQAVAWATEIGEGLAFAHSHGIVHRDIKPENLLLHAGHMMIADFGIARALDRAATERLTSQQVIVGTPNYMSPEQADPAAAVDARSDVYSLACVVYEMLAGEPPFRGPTALAITAKKMAMSYPRLRVVRPGVPETIERAMARALAPVPADRFSTVEEFCTGLRAPADRTRVRVGPWVGALALATAVGAMLVLASSRKPNVAVTRQRVVVGIFENRTGDSRHDALSFMAADWITEGLQRTGSVDVVPTATALAAARFVRTDNTLTDPLRALSRETGANLVVNGSIYRDQDSLVLHAELVNADSGRLVGAVEPIRTHVAHPVGALTQLRARLMGLLALSLDDRVLHREHPPTYASYQAFSEGMDAYIRSDYQAGLLAFQKSYAADTTFVLPLLYAAFCHSNLRNYAPADSLLRIVNTQRERLNEHDRYLLDYQMAELTGRDADALLAIRRAAELAPTSKATYNFAVRALEARDPFPAESALQRLSPNVGPMRGWLPYWEALTIALHAQRKHRTELKAAREARRRFPERIGAYIFEVRALAAQGNSSELEQPWREARTKANTRDADLGALAYEAGAELWAHGDSNSAKTWFTRSYDAFSLREGSPANDARWGRARAAARLGRLREAFDLCAVLANSDSTRVDYQGWLGMLAAQLADSMRARSLVERLAADTRPYTFGRPQYHAARIAAALGDLDRATNLLALARSRGFPFTLTFHQDHALARLAGRPIMRELDVRER